MNNKEQLEIMFKVCLNTILTHQINLFDIRMDYIKNNKENCNFNRLSNRLFQELNSNIKPKILINLKDNEFELMHTEDLFKKYSDLFKNNGYSLDYAYYKEPNDLYNDISRSWKDSHLLRTAEYTYIFDLSIDNFMISTFKNGFLYHRSGRGRMIIENILKQEISNEDFYSVNYFYNISDIMNESSRLNTVTRKYQEIDFYFLDIVDNYLLSKRLELNVKIKDFKDFLSNVVSLKKEKVKKI